MKTKKLRDSKKKRDYDAEFYNPTNVRILKERYDALTRKNIESRVENTQDFYNSISKDELEIINKANEIIKNYMDKKAFETAHKECLKELEKSEVKAVFERLKYK